MAPNGHACRIVDERYTDVSAAERFPIVYCAEGGFLHRVMSLEYRGDTLEDNGLRSGELKFLPTDLNGVDAWDGRTSAYRLPDGSGFEVRHHPPGACKSPSESWCRQVDFPRCVRVETTADPLGDRRRRAAGRAARRLLLLGLVRAGRRVDAHGATRSASGSARDHRADHATRSRKAAAP